MTSIARRISLFLAVFAVALGALPSVAAATMSQQWDPAEVAVNNDPSNSFLLRPGQILAAPGDARDVARYLPGWKQTEHAFGITRFSSKPTTNDPAREILNLLAKIRKGTSGRAQGPAQVAPNYVFVGEAAADAINFTGEPRIQGGPGSSVEQTPLPAALPARGSAPFDGFGTKIAVLDTGMFKHQWLTNVQWAPGGDDVWDVEGDGYGDNESGHGTFIAGLIKQVAPAASVYAVKVLDSHGVGDDLTVAQAMAQLPADVNIVNLSLGGYTDRDTPPLAILQAMRAANRTRVVVAAAGNDGKDRPFWPAAFPQVLGVGAVEDFTGAWTRASYSNHGKWVDAAARGTKLQSTFAYEKTKVATTGVITRWDPTITFDGWASWDGTSFATPITAAMIARTMSREGIPSAADAQLKLLDNAKPAPADFPAAKLIDELGGKPKS